MPFGLQGAPATFQEMVNRLLDDFGDFASAYMDDVIVFSTSWNDTSHISSQFCSGIQKAGLTAKKRKCKFAQSSTEPAAILTPFQILVTAPN